MAEPGANLRVYLLQKARQHVSAENYELAFSHYLMALKLFHELAFHIREEFVYCLSRLTRSLQEQHDQTLSKVKDVFCRAQAACSHSVSYLCILIEHSIRLNLQTEAVLLAQGAIQQFPDSVQTEEIWERVAYNAVERWHFKMLNDVQRNQAYHDAIVDTVCQNNISSVLDIGSGTGLLSLFALEAEPVQHIASCEASPVMSGINRKCVLAAAEGQTPSHLSQRRTTFIGQHSTSITIPEQLEQRVDLVVTEIFDAALFGEHCLDTLQHAWACLLKNSEKERGHVVPMGAKVKICAIQCEEIRKETVVRTTSIPHLELSATPIFSSTALSDDDPYTTEDLFFIRKGYKVLSPIQELMSVNFTQPESFPASSYTADITLDITAGGSVDALAVWFDLYLTADIVITTEPSPSCCWEQAFFPVLEKVNPKGCEHMCPEVGASRFRTPCVIPGDHLTLQSSLKDGLLHLDLKKVSRSNRTLNQVPSQSSGPHQPNSMSGDASSWGTGSQECVKDTMQSASGQFETAVASQPGPLHSQTVDGCPHTCHNTFMSQNTTGMRNGSHKCFPAAGVVREKDVSHTNTSDSDKGGQHMHRSLCNDTGDAADVSQFFNNVCISHKDDDDFNSIEKCVSAADIAVSHAYAGIMSDGPLKASAETVAGWQSFQVVTEQSASEVKTKTQTPSFQTEPVNARPSALQQNNHERDTHCCGQEAQNRQQSETQACDLPSVTNYILPCEDVRRMNDQKSNLLYASALLSARQQVSGLGKVLDLSCGFPLYGLISLKLDFSHAVLCCGTKQTVNSVDLQTVATSIAVHNGIDDSCWSWQEQPVTDDIESVVEGGAADVIVTDFVDVNGSIRNDFFDALPLLRHVGLKEGGIMIPQAVDVYGVLIESPQLMSMTRVTSDDHTLGHPIAQHINKFQTRTCLDLDFYTLPHTDLTSHFHVFRLDLQASLPSSAHRDARCCWTSQLKQLRLPILKSGVASAVVFYFQLTLAPGTHLLTLDPDTRWKQAAYMLNEEKVTGGAEVVLAAQMQGAFIRFKLGDIGGWGEEVCSWCGEQDCVCGARWDDGDSTNSAAESSTSSGSSTDVED